MRKEIVNDGRSRSGGTRSRVRSREHCDFIIDYFLTSGKLFQVGSGEVEQKPGASRKELEDEGDCSRDRWERTNRLVGTINLGGQGVT